MSDWSIINSNSEYNKAMERLEQLSSHVPSVNSAEGRELMLLGFLIQEYEDKNFSIQYPDPIEAELRAQHMKVKRVK